ncbi:MAG: hypothetical protein COW02_07655 [Comamonadaceae bacterium CG12_big_fil_rev_8_21_14_0_65_59_15]|nr:MAG: hypothetical protein COW02_07655 [Comamonadaceae bacterium CG12_big_fil_rev_8_21_14_0_65_59_15]
MSMDSIPISSQTNKFIYLKGISGFGNRIRSFLEAVFYSLITGRKLLVDWTDGVYAPRGINAFDSFFDSPIVTPSNNPSLLVPDKCSVIPPSWQGGLGGNWRDRINYIKWREDDIDHVDPYSYFNLEPNRFDYPEDVIVWLSWTFRWGNFQNHRHIFPDQFKQLSRDAIKAILMRDYIQLKKHIIEAIDQFQRNNFGPNTIGVHVRYTDNLLPKFVARRNVIVDNYFPIIDKLLDAKPDLGIFLCTDNIKVLELFEKSYSNVFSTPKFYPEDNGAIHSSKLCEDKVLMGEQALVDMFLLSRCERLLHTGTSSFTEIPLLIMGLNKGISVKDPDRNMGDSTKILKLPVVNFPLFANSASYFGPSLAGSDEFLRCQDFDIFSVSNGIVNLALHKQATQSSLSRWSSPSESSAAVSGIKSGEQSFHTDREPSPWWQVDLGRISRVTSMVIFNRGRKDTPMANRATSMMVLISTDGLCWEKVYSGGGSFGGWLDNLPLVLSCPVGKQARYVTLQLAEENYFHLDEVEIFGEYLG